MRTRLALGTVVVALLTTLPAAPASAAPAHHAAPAQHAAVRPDPTLPCNGAPAANSDPGWFPDRYTQCRRRIMETTILNDKNEPVGTLHANIVMWGYGNNGAREFNYLITIDNISKEGAPDLVLDEVHLGVWIACEGTFLPCPNPVSGERDDTVAGWRAVNYFATTLVSPETPDPGPQIERHRFALMLSLTSPGQPYFGGPPGELAYSNVRYDSASYVGRARGAVFLDYRLRFEVSLSADNQDESALHILHATAYPELTLPSWAGKSVPGRDGATEPLTRMYNPAANDANRRKSEGLCRDFYGSWDPQQVNCDEYPFASTYEGSRTGPERNGGLDRFSVRLIDAADNQFVGNQLLEVGFYRANRVLDGDQFWVAVVS